MSHEDTTPRRSGREILLVYDGECPLCNAYCRATRIRESVGTLKLVDARHSSDVRDELTRKGLDIDQGMALKVGDVLYYGSDAILALSLLSSRAGVFNRFNYWLFRSERRAHLLYPLLRGCRNLLLKLLRRSKINNLGVAGNDWF
jgi:predicted DCC family thiol-disulfide oxidoreductase YuxK